MIVLASSGVEKTIRLWSKYSQEPFKGAKVEESFNNFSTPCRQMVSRQEAIDNYSRTIFDESADISNRYLEDEDMINFFDAMNGNHEMADIDVSEDSIVGTGRMLHFHQTLSEESEGKFRGGAK